MTWELKRYDDHTLHLINTDIDDLLDIDDARLEKEKAEKMEAEKQLQQQKADDCNPAENSGSGANTPDNEQTSKSTSSEVDCSSESGVAGSSTAATTSPTTAVDKMDTVKDDEVSKEKGGSVKDDDPDRFAGSPGSLSSESGGGRYHALCLHFTLPAASYATMCLREISRQDTSTSFHASLNALPAGQHPSNAAVGAGRGVTSGENETQDDVAKGGMEGIESSPKAVAVKGAVIKIGASFTK